MKGNMKKTILPSNLCLVTGANGFTGRFVCRELNKRNIPFIALAYLIEQLIQIHY